MTFVKHPLTNDQTEAPNKVILKALRMRHNKSKGQWKEELPSILWAYHCLPQTTTKETPFRLTYGMDVMILVEVWEPSTRRLFFQTRQNEENIRVELDMREEVQEMARIKEELPSSTPQEDTTPKSGLVPFSLVTQYGEFEERQGKFHKQESWDLIGKAHSGSWSTWTMQHIDLKYQMEKQS